MNRCFDIAEIDEDSAVVLANLCEPRNGLGWVLDGDGRSPSFSGRLRALIPPSLSASRA